MRLSALILTFLSVFIVNSAHSRNGFVNETLPVFFVTNTDTLGQSSRRTLIHTNNISKSDTITQISPRSPGNLELRETDTIQSIPTPFLLDTIEIANPEHEQKEEGMQLEEPVYKTSKDSLLYSIDGKKVYLWGDAEVKYQDMELKAAYIEYDMENNLVFAEGRPDSTGTIVGKPVFVEGTQTFRMDKMYYNFNTKKAKISNVITEEAGGYLHSHDTKLMPDKTINIGSGKFTTCDLDHPHFYIAITKAKLIPNSKLVTGPAYVVVADVPFPFILPFGFFPSKRGRSSGIIIPRYGEERNRGFFLDGGGFYLGINDYVDLKVTGSVYSRGSWSSNMESTYRKRYKYSGGFSFALSQNVFGEKGFDDYVKDKTYSLNWRHSQDPKANPNSRFSANLNMGSPSHNRYNAKDVNNFLSNNFSSSIAYSKVWADTPFSMSISMNHSQNNLDSTITVGFPKGSFNMNRIYPLKRKNSIGRPTWYEKIGLSYSGSFDNSVNTRTDSLLTKSTVKNMRNGLQHRVPVSTSFNILKHIMVSPSASYSENWYVRTTEKRWDEEQGKVVSEQVSGFKRAWQYNTGVSMSSKLYGMYSFSSNSKVQAIRHVMTPSISMSFQPDFSHESYGFYRDVVTPTDTIRYSIFEGTLYGGPGRGKSGSIGFSLGNNLEMKMLTEKDTTNRSRKIRLLESFNFSTSYNLLADSLRLQPISFRAHTTLFEKFNISFNSSFDPYAIDEKGVRYNTFQYNVDKRPFRLTRANAGLSFSLRGESRGGGDDTGQQPRNRGDRWGIDPTLDPNLDGSLSDNLLDNDYEQGYVDYNIPWSINVNYTLSYSKPRFESNVTQSMSFSGSLSLTPKWQVNFYSGFDFKKKKLTTTSINISRDLHCWEMGFTVYPIGILKSYSFRINVKSGTLRELKYTKTKSRYDY